MSIPNLDFIPHATNHLFSGSFEALALPERHFGNAGIVYGSFFKDKHMFLQFLKQWSICFPSLQDDCFLPFPHPASSTSLPLQFTLSWWSWFPFHWESISKIKEEHLCFPWQCASSLFKNASCSSPVSCIIDFLMHWMDPFMICTQRLSFSRKNSPDALLSPPGGSWSPFFFLIKKK